MIDFIFSPCGCLTAQAEGRVHKNPASNFLTSKGIDGPIFQLQEVVKGPPTAGNSVWVWGRSGSLRGGAGGGGGGGDGGGVRGKSDWFNGCRNQILWLFKGVSTSN